MKWLKHFFSACWIAVLGMAGGQGHLGGKTSRRFGIPVFILAMGNFSKKTFPFLLLMPLLAMGYGESSWLASYVRQEWLLRAVYAFMLALPFLFFGIKRWGIATLFLIAAFQVRAGSLGHIGWFGDLLIEDIVRYGTLGILITVNLFKK